MVIVAVFGLLVLFSIISIVTSAGDQGIDPRDDPLVWTALARR